MTLYTITNDVGEPLGVESDYWDEPEDLDDSDHWYDSDEDDDPYAQYD